MALSLRFVVISGLEGRFTWELRDDRGHAMARSLSSYADRSQIERDIDHLRRQATDSIVKLSGGAGGDDLISTKKTPV